MAVITRERILVVEDDVDSAKILKIQMESAGFEAHTVEQGVKALNYAAEHPVDLVILDLRLPDISGLEVCKRLRKLCHPWVPPILILTAMNDPADRLHGFAHGADAYLTKPYQVTELLKTVSVLLGDLPTR